MLLGPVFLGWVCAVEEDGAVLLIRTLGNLPWKGLDSPLEMVSRSCELLYLGEGTYLLRVVSGSCQTHYVNHLASLGTRSLIVKRHQCYSFISKQLHSLHGREKRAYECKIC